MIIDFARKPARRQAVKLNRLAAILRRLCYILAQKGDPTAGDTLTSLNNDL